jgi:predicted nuclease of restriction endonuclease-like (RecB) superfamily
MNTPIDRPKDVQKSEDYKQVLEALKQRVTQAQYEALKTVNRELILLYRDIGRVIVEKQEQFGWGEGVVQQLARDLQVEFPGVRGFSRRNVFYMRRFYMAYRDDEKVQTLSAQIPWSHNTLILDRCKSAEEREYYLGVAARFRLSYRTLDKKVREAEYSRYLLNQTNFGQTLAPQHIEHALLAVKDDYNLDFLGLTEEHSERQLEDALMLNITKFLSEMGGYFTFVGRQFRVEVDDDEYFIDLLFYHRRLRSLVAVELKAGKFQPEFAGKMQFYLSALDDKVRLQDENPSIGIIVCRSKDRTVVEYTLRDVSRPIGVASYNHYSSLEDLPDRISRYLPSPQEIEERLSPIGDGEDEAE